MKIHPMWEAYPELQSELIQTIELIDSRIHLRNKSIEHALVDMLNTGGKLVRPAYTLLFQLLEKSMILTEHVLSLQLLKCCIWQL